MRDAEKAERELEMEAARKAQGRGGGGGERQVQEAFPAAVSPGWADGAARLEQKRLVDGMGGGMPNIPPELLSKPMSDPELMAAMQNPRVMAALQECMGNPADASYISRIPRYRRSSRSCRARGRRGSGAARGLCRGGGGPSGPSSAGFEDVTDGGSAGVDDVARGEEATKSSSRCGRSERTT